MTNDEIRIAVAEELGWKWWSFVDSAGESFFMLVTPRSIWPIEHGRGGVMCQRPTSWVDEDFSGAPDFPNDLNACAEMEHAILDTEWIAYKEALVSVTGALKKAGIGELQELDTRLLISATARQRCEAFLRVRGKWKD